MIYLLCGVNFFLYYAMCEDKKNIYYCCFIFFSFLIMLNIDVTTLPDYDAYFLLIDADIDYISLLSEPYYYYLGTLFKSFFDSYGALKIFYNINFIITLSFFIWLSFVKTISVWRKLILYSFYYYLFSYILLRNTPAYLLCGLLFYSLHVKKVCRFSFFSFLFHTTSIPVLTFSILRNKKADWILLLLLLLYLAVLKVLFSLEVFGLYEKFLIYSTIEGYGTSIFHRVYFIIFILFNLFVLYARQNVVFNYTYSFIFATYLFLHFFSPVMGFRFSIYLIFYLMLHPFLEFDEKISRSLNILSIFLMFLTLFNLYSIHPF